MDTTSLDNEEDFKLDFGMEKPLCRCCLTTERKMVNAGLFEAYFQDLANIDVSKSDGLPLWLCLDCTALLRKAVKFKHKILRAHTLLYEYVTRCAPFPIDAQDPELTKYASPHLAATSTLTFDTNGKGRIGYQKILEHEKNVKKNELDVDLPTFMNKFDDDIIKEETDLCDYEQGINLEEFKTKKITEEDLTDFLEDEEWLPEEEPEVKKKPKKKKKEVKVTKKKQSEPTTDTEEKPKKKTCIRRSVELDPNKIRVITLNPEEQIRQTEEESKTNLKFPFQCNLCFRGFNFENKLQNHMFKHSPARGPFECKLCTMYLPTAYSLSVHSQIHTRRYECVECGRRVANRETIIEHYRTQHEGHTTIYTCQFCEKVFVNRKTHAGHMRNHHSGERPKCDQCGKSFVNADSLIEHQLIHQGIKNYECEVCGARFRTRAQIKGHQLKHSTARDYYCVECDTRFKSAHSLQQHLQKSVKHNNGRNLKFGCTRCPRRFLSERLVAEHVRVQHEGARPHVCGACGAALATRSSLAKHVASIHAGRRPPLSHVCDTCGKAFRVRSALVNHVRTHTGEKPFACPVCGRKFAQRSALRTHNNLVHLKHGRAKTTAPPDAAKATAGHDAAKTTAVHDLAWNKHDYLPAFVSSTYRYSQA